MASWNQLEQEKPDLAEIGRKALWHEKHRLNFAFLATVRKDGTPRIHPVCPAIVDGELYVVAEGKTPKKADLRERGRYALHSTLSFRGDADGPDPEGEYQFYVSGGAVEANDPETRAKVQATYDEWKFGPDEVVFRLSVDRALHTTWKDGYVHSRWQASGSAG